MDMKSLDAELAKIQKTPRSFVGQDFVSFTFAEYEDGLDRIELEEYIEQKIKKKKEAPVMKTKDKKTVAAI